MTRGSALEIVGVGKAFRGHLGIGRTVAVNDLSLEVPSGEVFGLLGPNGAGKTTTLKMIVGLVRPDRGRVRVLGRPPADPAVRARMGFLPESPYFYDYLTGGEFLGLYGTLQGIPGATRRERVEGALSRVGLAGQEKVPLRRFSKGMLQRIGLAQAIQHDPDLVILDEPMSGLDPVGRREVRDIILSLRRAGKTVFFSSHILQDAEMVCDRVAILVRGRVRFTGSLEEILSRKVLWYEVAVSGELPEGIGGERVAEGGRETLLRVGDVESLGRLLAAAQASGARISSVWPRRETLEDLFLREVRGAKEGEGIGR